MKKSLFSFSLILFLSTIAFSQITDYQRYFATARPHGHNETFFVLRKWNQGGVDKVLIVHPENLQTDVRPANTLNIKPVSIQDIRSVYATTAYVKALNNAYENDNQLKTNAQSATNRYKNGIDLTIDLCGATSPLNRSLIQSVLDRLNPEEKPLRLTVSVTGLWMIKHPTDLTWLKNQEKSGLIDIRWANHSFHHEFPAKGSSSGNFVPSAATENDVLQTEKLMLVNGITPSVFFSLPGQSASSAGFDGAAGYGLIAFHCDKWQSDGSNGMVISANGNERLPVNLFLQTFMNNRAKILPWQWIYFER